MNTVKYCISCKWLVDGKDYYCNEPTLSVRRISLVTGKEERVNKDLLCSVARYDENMCGKVPKYFEEKR